MMVPKMRLIDSQTQSTAYLRANAKIIFTHLIVRDARRIPFLLVAEQDKV